MKKLGIFSLGLTIAASMLACNQQAGTATSSAAVSDSGNIAAVGSTGAIMYVNSDTLAEKYQHFVDVRAKLEAKVTKARNDLQAKSQAYQRELADYNQKAATMSASERQATEERLIRHQNDLGQMDQKASADIAELEQTEFTKVYTNITDYLKRHSEEKGYRLVLTYSKTNPAVLYADPSMDITNQVIEALNKEYEKNKDKQEKK